MPPGVLTRSLDIDFPCAQGKTTLVDDGVYDVVGAGADIWADGDQFQFAYVPLRGDFSISAHIAERDWGGASPPAEWGKFGLMVRQDCSYRSRYAFVQDSPDPDSLRFSERPTHRGVDNFESGFWPPPDIHPNYLRLDRVGETFIGYASPDGVSWTKLHEMRWEPPIPCEVLAGLAVTSHDSCVPIRIRFDQVAVQGGDHECPPAPSAGGSITWNVRRSEVNQGLSYSVAGLGWIGISGDDGLHAIEGESRIHIAPRDQLGPDLHDSLDIGPSAPGTPSPPGATSYDPASEIYAQAGSGYDIWATGDGFQFAYQSVVGDFDVTARILERDDPTTGEWGRHGLMARQDCSNYSRFSLGYEYLGKDADSPTFTWRPVHGVPWPIIELTRFDYPSNDRPDFMRLLRRGNSYYSFLSRDGATWEPIGANTWQGQDLSEPVLVGFITSMHASNDRAPVVKFQIIHLGSIDPPLSAPLGEDLLSPGSEVYSTAFDDLADFQVQSQPSGSEPKLMGGRLRLQEQSVTNVAASAFRKAPLEEIDSRVFQFDFDVFLKSDGGEIPADGLTFVVAGGSDPPRVGLAGGDLGYTALGMEDGAGNRSTNSLAVEFDTWQNGSDFIDGFAYATDGPGSPAKPRTYHVGIDAGSTVDSVVQTAEDLPDIFDPAGIHARVRYNRGRVTVWLASNAAGAAPLKQYLQADVLPISFEAPDQRAVFGFTAATGANTETGEVDNLKVTVFDVSSSGGKWLRCDSNGDGARDISDPVFVLEKLFQGGQGPGCAGALDCNSDNVIDISDVVFDLAFQFLAGDAPAPPYPSCDRFPGCSSSCP